MDSIGIIMPGSFRVGSNLPQLAGGVGSPVNPAAAFVTNLGAAVKLWLRADTGVVASGGTATGITDKSATAAVLSGSVALVPGAFGSFAALQSSGTNLSSSGTVSVVQFEHTQPFSVMLAMKRTAAPGNPFAQIVGQWENGGGYGGWWLGLADRPYLELANAYNGAYCRADSTASLGASGAHTIVATYDGSGHPAGIAIYVDGVAQSLSASDFLGSNTIVFPGQTANFGGSNSGNFSNDQVAEIVVADIAFTSAQAVAADAYLNAQYAIH